MPSVPPRRRWFQFGLPTLLIVVAAMAVATKWIDDYRLSSELDGTWIGTGRWKNVTLEFSRGIETVTNLEGSVKCKFEIFPETGPVSVKSQSGSRFEMFAANGAFRRLSPSGTEEGFYRLDGDTLEFRGTNVGKSTTIGQPLPSTKRLHAIEFKRKSSLIESNSDSLQP
jgi:hypothetical protein